ncbi:MAG: SdrD B-like domain-containing protein [Ilumatobacter sp.]
MPDDSFVSLLSYLSAPVARFGRIVVVFALMLVALPIVLLTGPGRVLAGPPPVFTMFVPFEDQQVSDGLAGIHGPGRTFDDTVSTIDITAAADESVVYWDHWEDGYEADIANPTQSTTVVWGGSDTGGVPNFATEFTPGSTDYEVDAGTVIFLQNRVPLPRFSTDIRFDGRDKVASTRGFAMTRAGWDQSLGTVHAGAVAATDLSKWGTSFDFPVGQNIGFEAFDYTGLGVMASDDDTLVQIDSDGDGEFDDFDLDGDGDTADDMPIILAQGETVFIDGGINAGGSAQTSKPAQAHLITGERNSRYEGRWFEVFPEEIRGDQYVAAAGSTSATQQVTIFLHNPGNATITVEATDQGATSFLDIAPGAVASFDLPNGSGARFSSPGNPFIAVSGTVAATGTTATYDWGYSLVPTSSLTPGVVVGWGKGNPSGNATHNPVWVAPLDNITTTDIQIYVDFDGDGAWDQVDTDNDDVVDAAFYTADAFESIRIRDVTDRDMTGARISTSIESAGPPAVAASPTEGTLISVAWGQDPDNGTCCDAYDLGTPVLPSTALVTTKSARLVNDLNADGNVNPGDTLEYTIHSVDAGALALTNVTVVDTLASTLNYVPSTTTLDGVAVADDTGVGETPFPLDNAGLVIPTLGPGQSVDVTFEATLVNPFPLFVQNVRNDVSVVADQANSTATSIVPVVIPDLYIAKNAPTSPQLPGASFDYVLDVSNVSLSPQTGIDVADPLPPEVIWNSTSVTRPIDDPDPLASVDSTDTFDTPAYDNNDTDWETDWSESGDDGSSATGDIAIESELLSNRLRLQGASNSVARVFDASTWDKAFIDFDWRRENFELGDSVSFQISTTGGSSWIELDAYAGVATDPSYLNNSYDLTRYVGQDIAIRFVTSSGMDATDRFFLDDVRLDLGQRILETVPGTEPVAPDFTLYTGGDLLTGENFTVTVNVSLIDPIAVTVDEFTNTASATSAQNLTPVVSSATVEVARASIGDTVWHDQNGDGVVDAGEPRLGGVEVSLFDSGGALVTTATTDASGQYGFGDLDPGSYTVSVTSGLPAGMVATDDADGGQDQTTDVTVTFGEDNDTTDFGYALPASLGDRVFGDLDGDASEVAPDFGIDGLTVTLTGTTPNASHQSGTTTVTNDGDYLFSNLLPGTYEVTVDTSPLSSAAYATTAGGDTQTHVLVSDQDLDTADFGYVLPAVIGDLVWHDLDADGTPEVGEPAFSGATVTLTRTDASAPTQTRITDANGYYLFANLDAGVYDVAVSLGTGNLPAGYDSSTGGSTQSVSVLADQVVDTADFGFYTQGSIGDLVFDDLNGDGDRDAGEPGIDGLTVSLDDGSTVITTVTTNGAYDFTGLEPGTYTVSIDTAGFAPGTITTLNGSGPHVLASTADIDTADFGYLFPATFGDFVWHDLDGDGTFDAGEPGLDGVELTLSSPVLATDLTATTSGGGNYLFSGLVPGTYTVTLDVSTLPAGYAISTGSNTDSFAIVSGTNYADADFGANTTADIGDFVFHDLNGNGVWDDNGPGTADDEPALVGVDVTLTGTVNGAAITSIDDTTDANGNYLFTDLDPGSYTVSVADATLPPGYTSTGGGDTRSTMLQSDSDDLSLDFGYATTTSIGDLVWHDLNGDGLANDGASAGLGGIEVTIVGISPRASHPGVGTTTTTGSNGAYLFDTLAPGTYEVSIALAGPLAGAVSSTGGTTRTVTVQSADPDLDVDFGVYFPGSIGDLVFDDANGDGDDTGDAGLGVAVTVNLTGSTPAGPITAQSTTADATTGAYEFTNLAPGTYTVTITTTDLPAGWDNTLGGTSQTVVISSNEDDDTIDFGFSIDSNIGDLVFDDLDGDGTYEPGDGDAAISGIDVSLYSGSTATVGNFIGSETTDGSGFYGFDELAPGTYTVEIDTADLTAGSTITTASGSSTYTVTLTSGTTDLTLDYGVALPITIGDLVFEDLNGNGSFDTGEPGIADATGITVTLDGATSTSTTDGAYTFTGVVPGSHTVAVDVSTVPAGYVATTATTSTATYESGEDIDTVDFGFVRPASLGDFVFDDLDGDGAFDIGEPGLAGVTLTLSGPGVAAGTEFTTAASGAYSFGSLAPGTYTVTVSSVPAGYSNTLGGTTQSTTLVSNGTDDSLDFGFFQGAAIGDEVFDDADGNGSRDLGEAGFENVVVTLYAGTGTTGAVVDTDTTDSTGDYGFTGLAAGTYTVATTGGLPVDAVQTLGGAGYTFSVVSGDDVESADFGYYLPGSIGDYVWEDLDGDGDQSDENPADNGIENVSVQLYIGTSVVLANLVTTENTDADGAYSFAGLAPGTYTVAIDTTSLAAGAMSTTGGFVVDTIVVASGDDVGIVDFGVANPASIGDLIFADNDGSTDVSAGDANLDGVTVTLTGPSGDTDVTGTDGIYGFSGLFPGTYTVTVSSTGDLDGDEFSTTGGMVQTVTVQSGDVLDDVDFGFAEVSSIGDLLFHDIDGNGVFDGSDVGIEDVDITITGTSVGASHAAGLTIETGTDGAYAFTGLLPGSYSIVVDTGDPQMNAAFGSTTGGNSATRTVTAGQSVSDADFGYTEPGTIGDYVFTDPNGDGDQSDAIALGGVSLELRNGLGVVVDTTSSNVTTGAYSFTDVAPGAYTVAVVGGLPTGAFSTTGGLLSPVTLTSGQDIDTADFGFAQPATIGDLVYVDANADGADNGTDAGFAATVTVTGTSVGASFPSGASVTSTGGAYSVGGLNPGTYTVSVSGLPANATRTQGASDYSITVESGDVVSSADFGFWQPASIGDEVFEDITGNGTRELGDPGLAGVTLEITGPSHPTGLTFTTVADGLYDFDGLAPGSYTIAVTGTPAGAINTLGGTSRTITVTSGGDIDTADFAFALGASIGDFVWNDLDGDGVQNDGDADVVGIENVTVSLYTGTSVLAADLVTTDDTDANGAYGFAGLEPGTYTVAIDSSDLPSGARSSTGGFILDTIVIESGDALTSVDFGVVSPASLGDRVFQDVDGNGAENGTDTPFASVDITVVGTSTNADHQGAGITISTDDGTAGTTAGDYLLDGLFPGTYQVTVTPGTGGLPADAIGAVTQTVTLTSGQTDLSADFPFTLPASIGDQLFIDNDADGAFGPGDTAITDVDITLTGPGQPAGGTTTSTSGTGTYDFSDLTPGSYTVTLDVDDAEFVAIFGAGVDSTAISSTGGDTISVNITSTDDVDTADFGYYALGSIGDFVFEDANGDGNIDLPADSGIGGVTVTLTGGGLLTPLTTTTDGGASIGAYLFDDLRPGTYSVTVTTTGPVASMSATTSTTRTVVLTSGLDATDVDYGFTTPASIGDLVFDDLNGDGDRDAGEPGLDDVVVTLTGSDANGPITAVPTTTSGGGAYSFTGLLPGDYTVTVTNGSGDLADGAYAATTTGGESQIITLTSGDDIDTVDFGFTAPATIGDFVFEDLDGDGIFDAGEPGFENVVVQISGGALVAPLTTTTGTIAGGDAGDYSFDNLAPGTYTVQIISGLPAGAVATLGSGGTVVTVESNDAIGTVDFGAYLPIAIGDLVFVDDNGNQTYSAASGDTLLDGVELTLSGGGLIADLTTDTVAGGYGFSGLAPGTYTLALTDGVPADHVSTTGGNTMTVTLVSGTDRLDLDFGVNEPITIGDFVWHDLDGDATFDGGEPGLDGVIVELVDGSGAVIDTATTIAGDYSFTDVEPHVLAYTVRIRPGTTPAGFTNTTPAFVTVMATSGDDVDTADFGYVTTTSIGDYVWDDLDGNGIADDGLPVDRGIAGLTVTLTGGALIVPLVDTTDGDGGYSFDNLAPGTYVVTVTPPAGASPTTAGGNAQTVTVASNNPVDTIDFGYSFGASIGDRIWHDLDADGTDGSEPGIEFVDVLLSGNGVNQRATTSNTGAYDFTGLAPGTYTITIDPVTIPVGANSGTQLTATTSVTTTVTVVSGQNVDTVDYGFATTAVIGDTIFDDLNGDGIEDLLEPGLDGVTVELVDDGGAVVDTEVTNDGDYRFIDVAIGDYTVRVVTSTLPVGYAQTTPSAVASVTVGSDDQDLTVDLGFTRPSTVGDFVWHDLDADGIFDAGEPGLSGVTINVYDSTLTLVGSDTTDGNGAYSIVGIEPGSYSIVVDPASIPTGANSGSTLVASAGMPTLLVRTLTSGSSVTDADFAFHTTASIGDMVWHDRDADSVENDGAQGDTWLDAVTVELRDPNDNSLVASTITVDGVYSFDVVPGTYVVSVVEAGVPAGYASTTGNNPNTVTVESDEDIDTIDFGYSNLTGGAIGNEIFDDLDGDGVRDAGEPGITVTAELYRNGALVDTRTTTGGGYNFINLSPGDYEVRIVASSIPAGYAATTPGGNSQSYTIESGDPAITTADFGFVAAATIGDFVWHDRDANGLQDDSTPSAPAGLGGVTVELRNGGGDVIDSDTTAADGSYELSGAPGTYTVAVLASTVPDGVNSGDPMTATTVTSFAVTLVSNETRDDADFGFATGARIGDTIFDDLDGDGVQQTGEPGIVGVSVILDDGVASTTVTTGSDGFYEFVGVAPGGYTVSVDETTTPDGAAATTTSVPVNVTVLSDERIDDVDLGYATPGSIAGEVFSDIDADGIQTGDAPFPSDVVVDLLDDAGDVIDTTTTVGGAYVFTGVQPGDYTVRPAVPAGRTITIANEGSDPAVDSDVIAATGETSVITVTSGAAIIDIDAGLFTDATIGDTVFADLDGNGVQGADEPGVDAVDVTVRDALGNVIGTAITGADGTYSVTVRPGTHSVSIDLPSGYGPGVVGTSQVVTVRSGDDIDTVDFPLAGTGELSGAVIYDIGNDGSIDVDDVGLGGVTVVATWDGPDGPIEFTTTTDTDGSYLFSSLPPGGYGVVVDPTTLPNGIIDPTVDPDATIDLETSVVVGGGATTGVEFGVSGTADLGDNVFLDANENGELDSDETGVPGIVVIATVTTRNGVMVYRTVTDSNGGYEFNNLPAGEYTVEVDTTSVPAGLVSTTSATITTLAINGEDLSLDFAVVRGASAAIEGPIAADDVDTTAPDTPVVIPVLDDDRIVPGSQVSIVDVTTPPNGTVTINEDATVTYTPDVGFSGVDRFDYTICDLDGLAAAGDTDDNRAIFCSTATVVVTTPTEITVTVPLTPAPGTPSGSTPIDASPTAGSPSSPSSVSIPRTGSEIGGIQTIGLGLLLVGLLLWAIGRRRRDDDEPRDMSRIWPAPTI